MLLCEDEWRQTGRWKKWISFLVFIFFSIFSSFLLKCFAAIEVRAMKRLFLCVLCWGGSKSAYYSNDDGEGDQDDDFEIFFSRDFFKMFKFCFLFDLFRFFPFKSQFYIHRFIFTDGEVFVTKIGRNFTEFSNFLIFSKNLIFFRFFTFFWNFLNFIFDFYSRKWKTT